VARIDGSGPRAFRGPHALAVQGGKVRVRSAAAVASRGLLAAGIARCGLLRNGARVRLSSSILGGSGLRGLSSLLVSRRTRILTAPITGRRTGNRQRASIVRLPAPAVPLDAELRLDGALKVSALRGVLDTAVEGARLSGGDGHDADLITQGAPVGGVEAASVLVVSIVIHGDCTGGDGNCLVAETLNSQRIASRLFPIGHTATGKLAGIGHIRNEVDVRRQRGRTTRCPSRRRDARSGSSPGLPFAPSTFP